MVFFLQEKSFLFWSISFQIFSMLVIDDGFPEDCCDEKTDVFYLKKLL